MTGSGSRRAIGAWLLALAGAWGVGVAVTRVLPPSDAEWAARLLDVKRSAARAQTGPVVWIVGGSGTHFGVECDVIARHAGRPCFNLGTHAGLGVATMLRVAQEAARPGDVVVLRFEHSVVAAADGEGELADAVRALARLPVLDGADVERDVARVLRMGSPGVRSILRGLARRAAGPAPGEYAIDVEADGDPRVLPEAPPVARDTAPECPSSTAAALVRRARARWEAKGIAVVLSPPRAQVRHLDEAQREKGRAAVAALAELAPVLANDDGNLSDAPSDFSDSPYHLTPRAREQASAELGEELRAFLENRR